MHKAVFVDAELTAWDVRQATKFALIDGREPEDYEICEEYEYLPGAVDAVLGDGRLVQQLLCQVGDGAPRCVALNDRKRGESVLLRREEGAVKMAYLPAPREADARAEHDLALLFGVMAERGVRDVCVRLPEGVPAGRHRLSDLLSALAESIDV